MVWAVVWCGLRLLGFFFPFVIGWVIAMIANPLVRFLEKRVKIVRKHSSIVLIVGVLGLVTAGLYFLIVWLLREMSGFIQALPELFELIQVEVGNAYQEASHLFAFIPSGISGQPFPVRCCVSRRGSGTDDTGDVCECDCRAGFLLSVSHRA